MESAQVLLIGLEVTGTLAIAHLVIKQQYQFGEMLAPMVREVIFFALEANNKRHETSYELISKAMDQEVTKDEIEIEELIRSIVEEVVSKGDLKNDNPK